MYITDMSTPTLLTDKLLLERHRLIMDKGRSYMRFRISWVISKLSKRRLIAQDISQDYKTCTTTKVKCIVCQHVPHFSLWDPIHQILSSTHTRHKSIISKDERVTYTSLPMLSRYQRYQYHVADIKCIYPPLTLLYSLSVKSSDI